MDKQKAKKFWEKLEEDRKKITPEMARENARKKFVWTEEDFKNGLK